MVARTTSTRYNMPEVSNTHSTDMCNSIMKSIRTPSPAQEPRRVSFGTNQVFYRTQACIEAPVSTCWYAPQDYVTFKATFVQDVKKTAKQTRCDSSLSGGKSIVKAFEKCGTVGYVKATLVQEMANFLQNESNCLAGLERAVAKKVFQDKLTRREELYDAVDDIQQRGYNDNETEAQLLRTELEEISRASRLFAHYLARASSLNISSSPSSSSAITSATKNTRINATAQAA